MRKKTTANAAENETAIVTANAEPSLAESTEAVTEQAAAAEKKTAAKSTAEKKKPGRPAGKTTAKETKGELKPELFLQFQNKEAVKEDAIQAAKDQYVAAGHRVSSIKSLQVYFKPEENAAYYVINQKFAGKVKLF